MADDHATGGGELASVAAALATATVSLDVFYDCMARIAARALGTPTAMVSMIENARHVVVGCTGVEGRARAWRAVPTARTVSLQAIEARRAIAYAAAGDPPALAVPFGNGVVGAVCVAGGGRSTWSTADVEGLQDIAEVLTAHLEVRRDVMLSRDEQRALVRSALHDELTGLPNRTKFVQRLQHVITRAISEGAYVFGVLFLDIDRFKVINDSLGHLAGDELLIAVAERIQRAIRPEDLVARLGGDEFAILLDGIGGERDALIVAERIHDALRGAVNLGGYDVFTSVSIGIVIGGADVPGRDRSEYVLRNADMAMYRAKAMGRATHAVFDRAMHRDALERLQLETELRHAIDRDELVVHYQPVVNLVSGSLAGVEALVRWRHAERGLVMPEAFIHLAEDTGLIRGLGARVLARACMDAKLWQGRMPIRVAVNLSAREVSLPDIVERIAATLRDSGLSPGCLSLEVTETAVIEHPERAIDVLARLRQSGIEVWLDDFGTGHSSLHFLHQLPLDGIKIDRSFIGRMREDPKAEQLVRTVITLAQNLGLGVIAEGVEYEEQAATLRSLGCTLAQGYLFGRPRAVEELSDLHAFPMQACGPG